MLQQFIKIAEFTGFLLYVDLGGKSNMVLDRIL